MIAQVFNRSAEFANDRRGTIAILYAVIFMTFALVTGISIDFGRMAHMKARVAAAADAAALAAGRALLDGRLSDAEVQALAVERFNHAINNANGLPGTVSAPSVVVDRNSGKIDFNVSATVPTTLTKMAGFGDQVIPVTTATQFDQQDVEVGLALDVTGSMGWGNKIDDLRLAAKDLVDILIPDGGPATRIRIGLAPYSTSINAGTYAGQVSGIPSAACVYERGGSEAFTDAEPVGTNTLGHNPTTWCPTAEVQPITHNKTVLKNSIDTYSADGWTAGHLGVAWAWYLVSPEWASIWPTASQPVSYTTPDTMKVVVLMTDGQFNTQYVSGNGNSSDQATSLCNEMKNQGITIYSVAFQAPTAAQTLLKGCASSTQTYFNASSGGDLRSAFQHIAMDINKLRVTK